MVSKKALSERDIISKYILPAIEQSGWNMQTQMKEEVSFTGGRIFVKGRKTKRGIRKRADIILYYKANIPVAVIEAKDNNHTAGVGMQQALEYAEMLDIPVAVASNGDGFVIQYRNNCGQIGNNGKPIVTENGDLDHFPTPDELWNNYKKYNKLETEKAAETSLCPYFFDAAGRTPRYSENCHHFSSATQIGMTATPKETKNLSNIEYFGEPIYTYSLKQGIDDGFLAPYKVLRVGMNVDSCGGFHPRVFCAVIEGMKADCNHLIRTTPPMLCVRGVDLEGYRPERGKTDVNGEIIEDRLYNRKDFDRSIVIDERTDVVAKKIMEYLNNSDPMAKTIVFCVDIEHAERMRQALLRYAAPEITGKSDTYIVRITGDDPVAKGYLEDFINPEAPFPVIATTSKLMSTGTDTQTCKLICLDANIGSMTEFKQIIGRGTRINEDYGKLYFTIIDFRNVTDKFADKDFDGAPVKIKETQQDDTLSETCIDEGSGDEQINPDTGEHIVFDEDYERDDTEETVAEPEPPYGPKPKVYINGVDVSILSKRLFSAAQIAQLKNTASLSKLKHRLLTYARSAHQYNSFQNSYFVQLLYFKVCKQYLGVNGQLITTNVKEYCKTGIVQSYRSLDHFLQTWNNADKKKAIIEELEAQGIIFEELKEEIKSDLDVFDLICHIAWDAPALTRKERVENVRKRNYWAKYGENARRVLNVLLDKYAETGIENIEEMQVLTIEPLKNLGTPAEIVKIFGGKEKYLAALKELENEIYAA